MLTATIVAEAEAACPHYWTNGRESTFGSKPCSSDINANGAAHGISEPTGSSSTIGSFEIQSTADTQYGGNEFSWTTPMDVFHPGHGAAPQYAGATGMFNQPTLTGFNDSTYYHPDFVSQGYVTGFSVQSPLNPNFNMLSLPLAPAGPVQQRTPCPWLGCTESFARTTDVNRHVDSVHFGIKHHCYWQGCPDNAGKGYCRLEKLRTHQRQKHGFTWV